MKSNIAVSLVHRQIRYEIQAAKAIRWNGILEDEPIQPLQTRGTRISRYGKYIHKNIESESKKNIQFWCTHVWRRHGVQWMNERIARRARKITRNLRCPNWCIKIILPTILSSGKEQWTFEWQSMLAAILVVLTIWMWSIYHLWFIYSESNSLLIYKKIVSICNISITYCLQI